MTFLPNKTSTLKQITFDADDPRHSDLNSFNSLVNYESDFKLNKDNSKYLSASSSSSSSDSYDFVFNSRKS